MSTQQQKSFKILLVGDACLDVYHYGVCERMSPEAPVPVFKKLREEARLGMSHNVRLNLESFGLKVVHFCNQERVVKHRFIEDRYSQQIFRYDEGENKKLSPMNPTMSDEYDAVVVSDYNKGFVTEESFQTLLESLDSSVPIFVDSKKQDLSLFKDCFIKINELEYKKADLSSIDRQKLVVTLGGKGAMWKGDIYPTKEVDVYDVCGAGDVFISALVYGFLKFRNIPQAIEIANRCAALSVTKSGTYVLQKEDINNLI